MLVKNACRLRRLALASRGRRAVTPLTSSRHIQTACTVYRNSLTDGLTAAIQEASALHHGFTSSDMPSQALIFISRHYFPELSAEHLGEGIHSTITKALGDDNIEIISAVVDEVSPDVKGIRGVSLLLVSEDEPASIHVFRDSVNRDISLGRAWKSQGDAKNQETIDDGFVPSGDWKSLLSGDGKSSPSNTSSVKAVNDVKTAIIVTKPNFSTLDWPSQLFPNADKYGLTPASTPFLTGLPITLTHNKSVLKDAGIALAFRQPQSKARVLHPGLKILGEPLSVTKAQGNILITLDNQPATYALLERIRSVIQKDLKISKDIQLFGQINHSNSATAQSGPKPLIKIIAGDPGKGSIALSGGYRVGEGDQIQLYYEDPEAQNDPITVKPRMTGIAMTFRSLAKDDDDSYTHASSDVSSAATDRLIENEFTAGSCSGIIVGGPSRTWLHESVGSVAILE